MATHKYKEGDRIILKDGRTGTITHKELSIWDNKTIPSYWVVYSKKVFPDGRARNTFEASIAGLAPKKPSIIARIFRSK